MKKTLSLLLVIAMIACMLPVFTVSVSAAEPGTVLPIATTPNGWELTAWPSENKSWTVTENELSMIGPDQGYYVLDMAVPAGKVTANIKTNAASNSCNGIVFCLTDADNDRAFWEFGDMCCYWLFVDENNRLRLSEVGQYNGNPGWNESLLPPEKQVDLDDKGIDVTAGFDLTAEWDGKGNIKCYVNGELYYTIDDTASPMPGALCGFRAKEKAASGFTVTSMLVEPAVVEITTAEQFLSIENDLDGNYKLMNDITLTEGLSYKEEGKKFAGTFDGNGKTITLDFVDTSWARSAVFCTVASCTIKNLNVDGKLYSNGNSTAALIGTVKDDGSVIVVENVTTDVDIVNIPDSGNGQGGIIGCVENKPTVKLINCTNKGDISGERPGGLVGHIDGDGTVEITNCVNEGTITATNRYGDYRGVGGFVGVARNNNTTVIIKDSTNKGTIVGLYNTANAYVGHNNCNTYTVENCTNTGKVVSGGLELTAELAVSRDQGIWGNAGFGYNANTKILSGTPAFHATPSMNNWKAYINGVEATDKVTVTDKGDRNVEIIADCSGIEIDGYAAVTIIWENGKYSTFGQLTSTKEAADLLAATPELEGKLTELEINVDSATAENPFMNGDQPSGSFGNLFDDNPNNKYEGDHIFGAMTIAFELTKASKISHYALGTGGDDASYPQRQPAEWKLWASVDGSDYVLLDYRTAGSLPVANNARTIYTAEQTDAEYKYVKLEILSFVTDAVRIEGMKDWCQIGEIKVYTCEHTWGEPVVEDATCTENGSSTKTCEVCGAEDVTVIESEGHDYVDGVCSVCGDDINAPETTPETNVPKTGDAVLAISALALLAAAATVAVARRRKNED